MGQKVNPICIRLGIIRNEDSIWYAGSKEYADYLNADLKVRAYLENKLSDAAVSRIKIERPAKNARVTIYSARPGVIIGKKGGDIEVLRKEVSQLMGVPVHLSIEEISKPDIDAKLVANSIARQLENRILFRKAMKKAVQNAKRAGALGIKMSVSGRLGGAEIARCEWYREGRVPLHTFRADIDYGLGEAKTTYGIVGVKVWIFKGEIIGASSGEDRISRSEQVKSGVEEE
jgi:small subunit ribosomal protein S3